MKALRILLADDDPCITGYLSELLTSNGHRVTVVSSGSAALLAYKEHLPELVLIALDMPEESGLNAIRQMRRLPSEQWVPIITLNACADDGDILQAFLAGADDYLIKPINPVMLEVRMRTMIRITALQRSTQAVIENVIEGIIRIDRVGRITGFNKAAETIFGHSTKDVLGQNVSMLMPSPHREAHNTYISDYMATGEARIVGKQRRVIGLRKNGDTFPMILGVSEVMSADEHSFIGLIRDVTEEEKLRSQVEFQATHDQLTGLPNRYEAIQHLDERFSLISRGQQAAPCSLFFCDLDGFKQVNDIYGHSIGDEVLRIVGDRLRSTLFFRDFIARIGGDEFVVIVDGQLDDEQARQIGLRLVAALEEPISTSTTEHPIGVSIGIAHSRNYISATEMINAADAAMYWAKRNGRNRAIIAK